MELKTFFDNFEYMAEAPNGIQNLRELILQLALQGKLVSQDKKDDPASVLLERIKAEKERLVKDGKIKHKKPSPIVGKDEAPFALPDSWVWTRLETIGLINPRNEVDDDVEVSFIPMKLIPIIFGEKVQYERRNWGEIKKGFTHLSEGDVGLAKITPCFQNGKSVVMQNLINNFGAGTTELHVFRPITKGINSEYVLLFLKSPYFIKNGIPKMTGSAGQKRVPAKYFSTTPFPLPPANEQKRIVAKVDELMVLCDNLEARKQKNLQICIQLNDATINKLLTARSPEKFNRHWKSICDNFDLLYSKPENVNRLRQTILQLAVQGKLVSQDPRDEPASDLLKKIQIEKENFIRKNKIRVPKFKSVFNQEVPFDLPVCWMWCNLDDIVKFITDFQANGSFATLKKNVTYYSDPNYSVLIRLKDLRNKCENENEFVYTDEHGYNFLKKSSLYGGEILVANVGAGVGTSMIMPKIGRSATLAPNMFLVIISELIEKKYFFYFCQSPAYWAYINEVSGGTGQPKMNKKEYKSIKIPIPPVNEQKRIVAKVDELMALCDDLESKMSQWHLCKSRLVEAAVADFLAA